MEAIEVLCVSGCVVPQLDLGAWRAGEALVVSAGILVEDFGTLTNLTLLLEAHCLVVGDGSAQSVRVDLVNRCDRF